MPLNLDFKVMPTKLRYKLLTAFCLMSLLPTLAGVYIASLFVKFPFEVTSENMITISFVILFSLALSYLGFLIAKQMVNPIVDVSQAAQNIADGKLDEPPVEFKGADELEDLTRSLRTISSNARELLDKVDKLTLKDKLTGLYNASYIRERLNEEIQRAIHYQRPCSFVYFVIDDFDQFTLINGAAAAESVLKSMANILNAELSEFDRAARIQKGEFGIIFFDKNKKKAIEFTQGILRSISKSSFVKFGGGEMTLSIGLSENPLDGVTAHDLYTKAQDRSKASAQKGKNQIEAFA